MNELKQKLEKAIAEADAVGVPRGEMRMGYVFGTWLADIFGPVESVELWERIIGFSMREMQEQSDEVTRKRFEQTFGLKLDEACSLVRTKQREAKLRVVR